MIKGTIMKEKCDRLEKKITLLFKISYLLLAILTFNSFSFGMPIMSAFVMISFALGSASICLRFVNWKKFVRMPFLFLLILFCLSFLVSSVANAEYGIVENFKWLIWTSFQLFILYTMDETCSPEYYKREFKILGSILLVYTFIAAAVSIFLLIIQFQEIYELENSVVLRGFIWGRLWGVYTDPNYGAIISSISIILSLFLYKFSVKKIKIFLSINIILQLLYIVFSDSRTGVVAFIVGLCIYIYMNLLRQETKLVGIKKYVRNIVIVLGVAVFAFLGTQVIKLSYNNVVAPVLAEVFYDGNKNHVEDDEELIKIGREEDIKVDPSNRRFDIWNSGLEIFKTSPILGTSYVSFIPYAEDNLPDTYVVNNDRGNFANMHNEYINVLVYQGIVGAAILLLFIVGSVYFIFKRIFNLDDQSYAYCSMLLTLVFIVASAMMFVLEGVYTNSVGAFMLWSSLGGLIHFLKNKSSNGGMV